MPDCSALISGSTGERAERPDELGEVARHERVDHRLARFGARASRSKWLAIISFCSTIERSLSASAIRRPPQLDRVGEGPRLFAKLLELSGVLRVLERDARNAGRFGAGAEHRLVEQRRIAEARRGEDDPVGGGGATRFFIRLRLPIGSVS